MDLGSILSGAADVIGRLFNTGYHVYQDQRDAALTAAQWQYKQAMDQIQMMREDTSVQRRVADLQSAGLNRNLAAGSAAGTGVSAGTPSSHSGRVDMNLGQVYDAYLANIERKQEIQNRKLQNEYQQTVNKMVDNERLTQLAENNVRRAVAGWQLGVDVEFGTDGKLKYQIPDSATFARPRALSLLSADLERQQMYADMARKENSLYYFNQFADRAVDASNIVFGARKAFGKKGNFNLNYNPFNVQY